MSKKISLRQFLMKSGKFERVKDCIAAIRGKNVTINNEIIDNPNYFFSAKNSLVKINSEKLKQVRKLYFLMNKPAGYLSQKAENEKTIYDLLNTSDISKEAKQSLFAIGRLDKDTEGLIILTNDGKLSDILMNPENKVTKRYYAILESPISQDKIMLLERGVIIEIEDHKYKTTKCKIRKAGEKEVYITITEGKKRQIKKMFAFIENNVAYLKRISIGALQLGDLKPGEVKEIGTEDIYKIINK